MSAILELTRQRRRKLLQVRAKAQHLVKLLEELADPATFKLYVSGKAAVRRGSPGIQAEDMLRALAVK